MYGVNAPVKWSNIKSSKLIHSLQMPPINTYDLPFLIEPNDQILTLSVYFGAKTPKECVEKVNDVKLFLKNENLKGILIGNDGLLNQFKYYFGEEYLNKIIIFPQMRCIPKYNLDYFKDKILNPSNNCDFLFLASSFEIKAVSLVIDAWEMKIPVNSKLYIVCTGIPKDILNKVANISSIIIIDEAPINDKLKSNLFKTCSVTISLTHIDGGANAFEGIEYGHAIITNNFHRGKYLVGNNNGIEIEFKNKYYDPGKYGVLWNSFDDYLKIVNVDIDNGYYEKSVQEISKALNILNSDKVLLNNMRIKSLEYAYMESLDESNKALKNIYKKIIHC
jgi:hypothetical protein